MSHQVDLTLRDYQAGATQTDQVPTSEDDFGKAMMVPLLGLAGETGSLLTEFKKQLRQGDIYKPFESQVAEELGDILWYVSNIASKMNLDLEEIARLNLAKLDDRYPSEGSEQQSSLFLSHRRFDDGYPESEQLPRSIRAEFRCEDAAGVSKLQVSVNGKEYGDPLTDNSHSDDGYRFHDVFHMAMCCRLGWSPIIRKLIGCKRKSDPHIDEVEDGARAGITEEAISAVVFEFAKDFSFFEGAESVEFSVLRTVKSMTTPFEVRSCTYREWESTILDAFRVWRLMIANNGGVFIGNQDRVDYERFASGTD